MLLEREQSSAIANILAHGYYRKKLPVVLKYFSRSRNWFTRFDIFVNALQVGIMNSLSEVKQAIQKGRQMLREDAPDEEERKRLEKALLMNQQLSRVLRTIVDGIAWRNLHYRRPILRLLSENRASGHLTEHEIKTYKKVLLRTRHRVIINDLTHFLRIADLTQIESTGHIILLESKEEGKKIKDVGSILDSLKLHKRTPSPQELRQIVTQMSFIDNKISIPVFDSGRLTEVEYEIIDDDFSIPTHHNQIRKMIRIANRKGYCTEIVEPGYLVNVAAYDKMCEKKDFKDHFEKYKTQYENTREKCFGKNKRKLISLSSWDTFYEEGGHFPRNYTPFSVLPFSNKDCVRMMMGFLRIDLVLDLDVFIQRIRNEGWEVKLNAEIEKQPRINPHEYEPFSGYIKNHDQDVIEDYINIKKTVDNKTFHMTIPFTYLLIMLSSFYKISFVTDLIRSRYSDQNMRNRLAGSHRVLINFSDEQNILR